MAGTRKLLAEVERTIKKINEGIDEFDGIWDKVYSASQQSQKEKYENDLKKEIKKLQRFREQLKSWMTNNEIKDKSDIIEARKVIEAKMEQFKVCEREAKTKAYSKEGLALAQKGVVSDPQERAKMSTRAWVQDFLTQLNEQVEVFESDMEGLQSNSKGKKQPNKVDIDNLLAFISKHKWHIQKLELVTRLLYNDALEPSAVDGIKDDIEYYIESNHEPDFLETYGDDDMYEALNMDALAASFGVGAGEVDRDSGSNYQDTLSAIGSETTSSSEVVNSQEDISRNRSLSGNASLQNTRLKNESSQVSTALDTVSSQHKLGKVEATDSRNIDSASNLGKQDNIQATQQPIQRNPTPTDTTAANVSNRVNPLATLSEEHRRVLQMLEGSFAHLPEVKEFDRSANYVPRNPCPCPPAFPSAPAPFVMNPAVFEKFDTDTLFFIFYYQQGTYQQYLAARELKKQTWAYHKKYMTWFKRHEEPKVTCEKYEQGTYVYFDYETGWCQRIKSEFTFEYSFLEDELVG